ncbi:hypothetical protein AVEN_150188-1 [Araneus ventricosus]|uniref:Uncharacterized protein n=1 Tax=Araneus ventricosus TaxID=182803 RepID=A0A4Y2J5X5_ARAVE|nr:hypothetical protein AVEN_150188-1 [Araneus ventricosus]
MLCSKSVSFCCACKYRSSFGRRSSRGDLCSNIYTTHHLWMLPSLEMTFWAIPSSSDTSSWVRHIPSSIILHHVKKSIQFFVPSYAFALKGYQSACEQF